MRGYENHFEVIRDPLWNNIRVDSWALDVLDSEPFQRLRYVRQLGHAFLVYPGATHTRFEHALGAYHLARRTVGLLSESGALQGIDAGEVDLILMAALLHDVGHYPFSHGLEEAGLPSHEELATERLEHPDLAGALDESGIPDARRRIADLIAGRDRSPLQGLISGSLDLDKIEYLTRDARMCGVPYGMVDVDRLIHSITVVEDDLGRRVGIREKGVSALESLLFAKYEMYRNVYWHHAVRSATVMFKRLVRSAIAAGELEPAWIARTTDEALMEALRVLGNRRVLAHRLRHRRLYKRVLDLRAADVPAGSGDWLSTRPDLVERTEDRLAAELSIEPGHVLLDFPAKPRMLELDLPLVTKRGDTVSLTFERDTGFLGIQQVAEQLHTSARRLRVFGAEQLRLSEAAVVALVERGEEEIERALQGGETLLR